MLPQNGFEVVFVDEQKLQSSTMMANGDAKFGQPWGLERGISGANGRERRGLLTGTNRA